MKTRNTKNILSKSIQYTYHDWYEGRISIGGVQYFDSEEELENIKKKIININWNDISEEQIKLIRNEQKKIFWQDVEFYFTKLKDGFIKMLSESEEKEILIAGTIEDFKTLFEKDIKSDRLKLSFINKDYSLREVQKIKTFYTEHIIRGNRNYDFVQSREQKDKSFRLPSIEVEAEVLFKGFKFIEKEYTIAKGKLSLKEIALIHVYKGIEINPSNRDTIVKKYGHSSGHKLYQHYNFYQSTQNRIVIESTPNKSKNKIDLLNNVKDFLVDENFPISLIEQEIKLLTSRLLNQDEED